MNPPDILKKIILSKQNWVKRRESQHSLSVLKNLVMNAPQPKNFIGALQSKMHSHQPAIIAEIKKASPSKGIIRSDFDPVTIAQTYQTHGATCLSILTDVEFFQGDDSYLTAVRQITPLPLLRKDFIIDSYQIYESRWLGADCILLIVAALEDSQLQDFTALAQELGLAVLVEVHELKELERALMLPTPLIGINNRNLRTFTTTLQTTLDLIDFIPAQKIIISESGIETNADIIKLKQAGVHAFLIGETFMRAADPGQKLTELMTWKL